MATYKHGVYVTEQGTALTTPIEGSAGLQVIFGTAPKVNAAPVLAYTFEEAEAALGYSDEWDKYTLCEAMYACFKVLNIAPVVFINVKTNDNPEEEITKTEIVNAITSKLREVFARFGLTPGILSAPRWSHLSEVGAALQGACENINGCFVAECVIDIDTEGEKGAKSYLDVKLAKEAQGLTSEHAIAAWPCVKVGEKIFRGSTILSALMAYTDAKNEDIPNLSPSNKAIAGLTGTCLADGSEIVLDQEQGNLVNSFGVVTFFNRNGFRAWGNNTCVYPAESDPKDRWISNRRFFTWRSNCLILTYFQKVDDPMNKRLIENICDTENIIGNSYKSRQIVADYKCVFIESENPVTSLMDGSIKFHLYLTPFGPAEKINFVLEFDPNALSKSLGGSN